MSEANTNILKTETKHHHTMAERSAFSKALIKGEYSEQNWIDYLSNLYWCYFAVEQKLPIIKSWEYERSPLILNDLNGSYGRVLPSTYEYVKHVGSLNEVQALAHLYVRWLGDLNGGHLIASKCPFRHSYLVWENRFDHQAVLKTYLSPYQNEIMNEAKAAFGWAERLNSELL